MELLKELFLTAFVALLFSFLIAKLVSRATSGGSMPESESHSGTDVDEETIMRELEFGQRLEVKTLEAERKVEFVDEIVRSTKDEELIAAPALAEEIAEAVVRSREFEAESRYSRQLPEKSESEVKFDGVVVVNEERFGVEKGIGLDQESSGGVAKVKAESPKAPTLSRQMEAEACQLVEKSESEVKFDDIIERMVESVEVGEMGPEKLEPKVKFDDIVEEKVENKEAVGFDKALEIRNDHDIELESDEISVLESKLERVGGEEKEVKLESDDDDDWEGIERTELEKVFAVAARYVEGKGELEGIGKDVQMEMYGLHKVATEGPCREPQPMALKVNARAKCDGRHCLHCARNAWQRLGNMSPEVAMEQYVALLSDRVPWWMKDNSTGENKQEPAKAGLQAATAHVRSSFPDYQINSTKESISELESTVTEGRVWVLNL